MLFALSLKGLEHNWLSPTVVTAVLDGLNAIDAGKPVVKWPSGAPVERRDWLSRRHGFRKKINAFWKAYRELTPHQKAMVRKALTDQTNLPAILSNDQTCGVVNALPDMERAISELFVYMFGQLKAADQDAKCIRDEQYLAIYNELPDKICPFCGLLPFRGPGGPRHALDHFMPISLYPFAGADLRNLPPMCDECNETFKGATDTLYTPIKVRRRCSDPYAGPAYEIRLSKSIWSAGKKDRGFPLPQWQIDFVNGPSEQAESWDAIFKVRERYSRDVLDADFLSWIGHFARWFNVQADATRDVEGVVAKIQPYIDSVIQQRYSDRAFLKAEVFRLVRSTCDSPQHGDDVKNWLLSMVENVG
jgi:hypothetical protein